MAHFLCFGPIGPIRKIGMAVMQNETAQLEITTWMS